jgi:hypothetical protein
MKALGLLLIAVGFVAGAFYSIQSVETVPWTHWGIALAVGIVGIVLARLSAKSAATSGERLTADIAAIETSLANLVEKAEALNADKAKMDPYDVRHRIDDDFMDDLNTFVQARKSLTHRYGVQAYADLMSHFATAERYLNRTWSASADGYVDEVHLSLDQAEKEFRVAQEIFERLGQAA